ncbi:MAG: tRNA (adenosine(37)-N6)-dimethylallyltransferase MiaA [Planctomycetes bacterium]|nr:tRNA (adenosine(37)-N6)-dimethylallyltransferase MiaA [Planctomycetota bacterium]
MILILGVTASGKATLAFELAKSLDAEIISVDSMKIYRRMDIGTAKPSIQAQEKIKYHLIDVVEPSEPFNVGMFIELTNQAIDQIKKQNKPVVAVGGTALYIKSLLYGIFEGPGTDQKIRDQLKDDAKNQGLAKLHEQLAKLDPQAALKIHPNDEKRIIRALEVHQLTGKPISSFQNQWTQDNSDNSENWKIIGLRREKTIESKRINARVKKIVENGLVDEVKSLLNEDKPLSKQAKGAIGYAEIIDHLNNKTSLDQAVELIKKNTRHMAKHQRTWFKTFKNVNWIDIEPDESAEKIFERTKELLGNI